VAEQLRLGQRGREGAAVHGDEFALAPAFAMQVPRHQLLAGTGLAGNEHRGIGFRHLPDVFQQGL
jgi:hypothetical protein